MNDPKTNKPFFALVAFFGIFWLVFLLFQNDNLYVNTLGITTVTENRNTGQKENVLEAPELTESNLTHWDAELYYIIKEYSYNIEKAGSDFIFAFFPLFPALWNLTSLNSVGILFFNFVLFAVAILMLYRIYNDDSRKSKVHLFILALIAPMNVVFLIPYTEATFIFVAAIGLYGLMKQKYWIYFAGFFLCALTRPSYTFLILSIVVAEFFFLVNHKKGWLFFKEIFLKTLPLIMGTALVSIVQIYYGAGSFFTFIDVQKYWNHVFSIPTEIMDWSHEGFAISVGLIFLVLLPLLFMFVKMFLMQILKCKTPKTVILEYNPFNYSMVLSAVFLVGTFLFILFFQGGNLHGLSRYVLCTPFFFVLLFGLKKIFNSDKKNYRIFAMLSLFCVILMSTLEYSRNWSFADLGFIILVAMITLWLLQDLYYKKTYKIALYAIMFLNVLWTVYLFNIFLANGWIYT